MSYLVDDKRYLFLKRLGLKRSNKGSFDGNSWFATGPKIESVSPVNDKPIAIVVSSSLDDYARCRDATREAWLVWANLPMPRRGEIVSQIGNKLRANKRDLGCLITLEMGKILPAAIEEVQEFIDMCDYAARLSRVISSSVFPSQMPDHQLSEIWNPLGPIGIVTSFIYPVARYGSNAALAMVCGDSMIWKGAPTTTLTSIATTKLIASVLRDNNLSGSISTLVTGGGDIGEAIAGDRSLPLVSFTGTTEIGRQVALKVQERSGRSILELGANNAIVVCEDADLNLVVQAILSSWIGTSGQGCKATRRLFLHEKIYDEALDKLADAFKQIKVGNPFEDGIECGPIHSIEQIRDYFKTFLDMYAQKGVIKVGYGRFYELAGRMYVEPSIITGLDHDSNLVKRETLLPILYAIKINSLQQAITYNNEVDHGLSSSLFTSDQHNISQWLGSNGSNCAIVNVNVSTDCSQVGAIAGGNKHTGNSRASHSWKQYMRRSTCSINYGSQLPLSEDVNFS